MATKYLYGAAVQGIQGFIYQTNNLPEIIGASEMVDNICNGFFAERYVTADTEVILHAAGNIKCIFSKKEDCERAVRTFPKEVVTYAPGITISQAVVEYQENTNFGDAINELENKLRIQRNIPMRSQTLGYIGIAHSKETGMPITQNNGIDEATYQKRKAQDMSKLSGKCFGEDAKRRLIDDNEDLLDENSWIAVLHIDGNGLGNVVRKIGKDKKAFAEFSEKLNDATIKSARQTYNDCKDMWAGEKYIPIYPVVLGGDDLTVICRGSIALMYAKNFIKHFEMNTKDIQVLRDNQINGLTACAGIAWVKASYPFINGYELAESLCEHAKKKTKEIDKETAPSCIMFHKMQDSFCQEYKAIVARELTTKKEASFCFGPYFIDEKVAEDNGYWSVQKLMDKVALLEKESDDNNKNSAKSALRQWLTAMHDDPAKAYQIAKRAKDIVLGKELKTLLADITNLSMGNKKYPVYDMLAYHTILTQCTK